VTEPAAVVRMAGLRPTRQRLAIIDALDGKERPVTAQSLHREVGRRADGPGLATVYRTLRAMAESGLVETFEAGEGEVAYKLCETVHHHHLICDGCGQMVTIPSCEVEDWARSVARRRGFAVTGHRADIYGLCDACRRRRKSSSNN
jgi:Fur family transcriptional regulator, ferric uptake regulator